MSDIINGVGAAGAGGIGSISSGIGSISSGVGSISGLSGSSGSNSSQPAPAQKSGEFSTILNKTLSELNESQVAADKAVAELATGEITDLHQAAIAIGKAETSMKLMLEIRNKAISAYKEVARTQL